jgi:flagellar protein FlbD
MVSLTRLDGQAIIVNADEIETIESPHNTTLSLISGKKIIVRETPEQIVERVIDYRRRCNVQTQQH